MELAALHTFLREYLEQQRDAKPNYPLLPLVGSSPDRSEGTVREAANCLQPGTITVNKGYKGPWNIEMVGAWMSDGIEPLEEMDQFYEGPPAAETDSKHTLGLRTAGLGSFLLDDGLLYRPNHKEFMGARLWVRGELFTGLRYSIDQKFIDAVNELYAHREHLDFRLI